VLVEFDNKGCVGNLCLTDLGLAKVRACGRSSTEAS
jgi:hypothetical protein